MSPTLAEMTNREACGYWRDVLVAGKALNAVFQPTQINCLIFGNNVPTCIPI